MIVVELELWFEEKWGKYSVFFRPRLAQASGFLLEMTFSLQVEEECTSVSLFYRWEFSHFCIFVIAVVLSCSKVVYITTAAFVIVSISKPYLAPPVQVARGIRSSLATTDRTVRGIRLNICQGFRISSVF